MAFLIGGANSATGYEIDNSLRYNDGDSARLSHTTGSSGSARTFTWSMWLKRSTLGSTQYFFNSNNGHSDAAFLGGLFNSSDELLITSWDGGTELKTNGLFRDVSAWYHIVFAIDTTQGTNTNRVKLYINGTQETSFDTASYPNQNHDFTGVGDSGVEFIVGAMENSSPAYANFYDGYISEFNFVDGAQKAASDFGETNDNGVWIPKKYTGSYGTNGYFLEFQQTGTGTASASTIGADTSGNTNHFTSTSLAAGDITTDTPTNNFCTYNPLDTGSGSTFSEGNLATNTGDNKNDIGTIGFENGKWYWEVKAAGSGVVGVQHESVNHLNGTNLNDDVGSVAYSTHHGIIFHNNNSDSSPVSDTNGCIIGCAVDMDNNKIYWHKDGTYIDTSGGTQNPTTAANPITVATGTNTSGFWFPKLASGSSSQTYETNFGNPNFSISSGNADANGYGNFEYAVPSGYYSLCTKNLAEFG
jgi:hypothetical protein